jgi:hypothetical protein
MMSERDFNVHVEGLEKLERALNNIVRRGFADLRQYVWPGVGKRVLEIFQDAFWSESASTGGAWAKLTAAYERKKLRDSAFSGILRSAMDRLYKAMTRKGAQDNVYIEEALSLTVGADGESGRIGRFHQDGASLMAARPIVRMQPAHIQSLVNEARRPLLRLAREEGFSVSASGGFIQTGFDMFDSDPL